jgi:hypothetical protein
MTQALSTSDRRPTRIGGRGGARQSRGRGFKVSRGAYVELSGTRVAAMMRSQNQIRSPFGVYH